MKRSYVLALLAACAGGGSGSLFDKDLAAQRRATGMREPITAASVVGDAYWPSASPDGEALIFTAAENGSIDVWKKALATGELVRLTDHSADDEDPAVSPDSKTIAFVSRREDAKGDIYTMAMDGGGLTRLTDELLAERAPAWAPDGKSLYVSVRPSSEALEDIYRLDIKTKKMERVTEGGGFDATAHPSGLYLVYAQPFAGTTRLVARRLSDGKVVAIGDGRRPEAFPRFVHDPAGTEWVYFTRYAEDDNTDGKITAEDLPSLYRLPFDPTVFESGKAVDASEPLTSGYGAETLASAAGDKLFFVASVGNSLEIQVLPLDGSSQKSASNDELLKLADSDVPPRMRRYFLRVVQARGGPDGVRARYEIARDFAAEDRLEDAQNALARVVDIAGADTPIGRLARLEELRNQFFMNKSSVDEARGSLANLQQRAAELAPENGSKIVRARARIVVAEAAEAIGSYALSLTELARVKDDLADLPEDSARLMRIEASVSAIALPPEEEQRRLIELIRERPRQVREVLAAKTRVLALLSKNLRERLETLGRLLPMTTGLAVIRVPLALDEAESLTELDEPGLAITKLEALRKDTTLGPNDLGRVLFALGNTQESAGDLATAISTFEALATGSSFNRVQKNRGRTALLRLALKKARADEARGDTLAAFEAYRTLARNNPQEAGTHRKVLELGDKLGKSRELDAEYAGAAASKPYERIAQYAAALAATYVDDLSRAKKGFKKALELDSSLAFAHMGLGWVFEQEEYRSPGTSDALERAVTEYTSARSIFEATRATDAIAESALNLGNAFSRLGQFDLAFQQYLTRETAGIPFQSPAQEILFRERFGQAGFRTGEYDVALMAIKDGIRLAEREGDDRRLGRMRALLALVYDSLDMQEEARASLVRARDEYATSNDYDRVIALDRTIGWLALRGGHLSDAIAALERAQKRLLEGYGPKGFKFGVTFQPLGFITPLPVDSLDASRAPFGFSRDDETELLQTMLARIYASIGDTDIAAQYQEKRLALLAEKSEKDSLAAQILPDYLQANAEMMRLALRRNDAARAARAFDDAAKTYTVKEPPPPRWIALHIQLARRIPGAKLDATALQSLHSAITALTTAFTAEATTDKSLLPALVELRAVLDDSSRERAAADALPTAAQGAADQLPSILRALDAAEPEKSAPASAPASAPVSGGEIRIAALLDGAELAFAAARDGEPFLVEAEAAAQKAGLWDVGWQADYLRFRLGPAELRDAALVRAGERVAVADVIARLLTPTRARGALWDGLMRALLDQALARNDANAVARHLERMASLEAFTLPHGLNRPDLAGAEASRKALEEWAKRGRSLVASCDPTVKKALPAHLTAGAKIIAAASEPWRSAMGCTPDAKTLAAALAPGDSFDWFIAGNDRRLHLDGERFTLIPANAPLSASSMPASSPAAVAHYVAGPTEIAKVLHVASATALLRHEEARNIYRDVPLDFEFGAPKRQLALALAAPSGAVRIDDGDARSDELAKKSGKRGVVRLALEAQGVESSPGVVRFLVAGTSGFESRMTSLDLPRMGIAANLAVLDGLSKLDDRFAADASRALALAGTPATLLCAPDDAKAHASLMATFYGLRSGKRAFDAWLEASASSPAAAKRCQYWGVANDDGNERIAFAEKRLKIVEALADAAKRDRRLVDAKALYEAALDLVQFLNPADANLKLSQKELVFYATLAQVCVFLGQFDEAIANQNNVLTRFAKQKDARNTAEARGLLGIFISRAGKAKEAAETLRIAAEEFAALKLGARFAATKLNQATALLAAGSYAHAITVYKETADAFAQEKNVPQQILALRNVGIVLEQNLSEFDDALETFEQVRALADATNDKTNRPRARLDLARIHRQLAEYEAALKAVREVLALIEPTDLLTKSESLLELARIFWYSNDYEQALSIQSQALDLASSNRKLDERRADFLRIQATSLEGLILLSQGKRIAASNRLRRALQLARITRRRGEESSQLNNFGFALRERGLLENAELIFTKAIAIDTDLKSKDGLAFDFRNLGVVLLRQGKLKPAARYLGQARELNKSIGNRYNEMQIQLGVGELALVEKRWADAAQAFAGVTAEAKRLKSRDTEWRSRIGSASERIAQGKPQEARAELEAALAIVEALGPKLEEAQSDEEKINLLKLSRLYQLLADVYVQSNDVAALWGLFERMRLKELRDQVPPYIWAKRLGVSLDDASDYGKLAVAAKHEPELEALFRLTQTHAPELQAVAPAHAIVHVRVLPEGIFAVVSREGKTRIVRAMIPRAKVLEAIAVWKTALDTLQPPPDRSAALFTALGQILDEPALAGGKLLIIGDSVLSRLPWAGLPLRDKRLVERAEIVLELSATHALATRKSEREHISDVVAVGPIPDDSLPFADLETRESVALFTELKKPARMETLASFLKAKRSGSFWHIALHGDSLGKNLQGSFVTSEDGSTLQALDLMQARLPAPTVLISACHRPGSEPNGIELVTALKLSGSRRVIAPVSRVYDDFSSTFVKRVVRRLAADAGPEALRAEQLEAIARGEPPAAWAQWLWFGR